MTTWVTQCGTPEVHKEVVGEYWVLEFFYLLIPASCITFTEAEGEKKRNRNSDSGNLHLELYSESILVQTLGNYNDLDFRGHQRT